MARKTEFELIAFEKENGAKVHGKAHIIKEKEPFVPRIEIKIETGHIQRKGNLTLYLQYRDLERFAVNILKALGSKKLASHNNNYRDSPYPNAEGQGVQ